MESKEAEKYIGRHAHSAIDWAEEEMVLMDIDAISAVEIAEQEMKDKAIEALTQFVENYCEESGRTDISSDSEHYIEVFTNLLNK